jgi:hypothetical protein
MNSLGELRDKNLNPRGIVAVVAVVVRPLIPGARVRLVVDKQSLCLVHQRNGNSATCNVVPVCVCVCVCVCVLCCVCLCVCACVCVYVCVWCVCVCARARTCVCVCARARNTLDTSHTHCSRSMAAGASTAQQCKVSGAATCNIHRSLFTKHTDSRTSSH